MNEVAFLGTHRLRNRYWRFCSANSRQQILDRLDSELERHHTTPAPALRQTPRFLPEHAYDPRIILHDRPL
ncbi:hypothetical protein C8Q79DRAFT_550794 [Trametes meyenii]|nr:hypothetical protein C8Q79DRAFT_550794 [Trametes meyenii]